MRRLLWRCIPLNLVLLLLVTVVLFDAGLTAPRQHLMDAMLLMETAVGNDRSPYGKEAVEESQHLVWRTNATMKRSTTTTNVGTVDPSSSSSSAENERNNNTGAQLPPQQSRRPVVLCASHGTTGTRFLQQTLCQQLGVSTVHHLLYCNDTRRHPKDVRHMPRTPGVEAHQTLVQEWYSHFCTQSRQKTWTCPAIDQAWMDKMHRLIDRVLESEHIDAVLDCPYPYFATYVHQAAQRIRRTRPIVLVSERNATEWVAKRLKHQFPLCIVVAKDDNDPIHVKQQQHLDVEACFQTAQQQQNATARLVRARDWKHYWSSNRATTTEDVPALVTPAFAQTQEQWRQRADIAVNLFAVQAKMDQTTMAHTFWAQVPRLKQYWKHNVRQ